MKECLLPCVIISSSFQWSRTLLGIIWFGVEAGLDTVNVWRKHLPPLNLIFSTKPRNSRFKTKSQNLCHPDLTIAFACRTTPLCGGVTSSDINTLHASATCSQVWDWSPFLLHRSNLCPLILPFPFKIKDFFARPSSLRLCINHQKLKPTSKRENPELVLYPANTHIFFTNTRNPRGSPPR